MIQLFFGPNMQDISARMIQLLFGPTIQVRRLKTADISVNITLVT
jgi:hypothetical protein